MKRVERILVPVDFSPGARAAAEYAHSLACSQHAGMTLLHAYCLPTTMSGIVPGSDDAADVKEARRLATDRLTAMAMVLSQNSPFLVDVLLEPGPPVDTILRRALAGAFDLIVMGHGRTGLSRLLLGSVAEGVLRRTLCPVLTIHTLPWS